MYFLSDKASRRRQREAQQARNNRAEIVTALSHGQITRRDLYRWGIFTATGALALKNGLPLSRAHSPRACNSGLLLPQRIRRLNGFPGRRSGSLRLRLEVEMTTEHRARGRADDDLVRLRQCLQTRCQVRRFADDRGLRCGSFADLIADDHRSGGDGHLTHIVEGEGSQQRGAYTQLDNSLSSLRVPEAAAAHDAPDGR
jgi:hypothetical protein